MPAPCPLSGTAEEKDESALSGPPSSLPLSLHLLCIFPTLSQKCDALQCCTLRQLPPTIYSSARHKQAGRSCYIIRPWQELDGCFFIMLKSLFMCGVLGVLLIPAKCDQISVCLEDDDDLRVDCLIKSQPNKINSYEFSWTSGNKEYIINTNVSGSSAEIQFKDKSSVEQLPNGYRLTLSDYKEKLPPNTTYMCKISGEVANVSIEKDSLPTCSAMSVFLKSSCSWIVCLLLLFYQSHS